MKEEARRDSRRAALVEGGGLEDAEAGEVAVALAVVEAVADHELVRNLPLSETEWEGTLKTAWERLRDRVEVRRDIQFSQ